MRRNKAMRTKRFSGWWILAILILIGLLLSLAAFFYIRSIPSIAELIPPPSDSLKVTILNPLNGSFWPMNYDIRVYAEAWSGIPLESLDLYINGQLYESLKPSTAEDSQYHGSWSWQPGSEGKYLLTVYAQTANGSGSNSEPVMITAGSAHTTMSPILPQTGDTLASLAEDAQIPIEQIQDMNPSIDPGQALDENTPVYMPNDPEPVSGEKHIPPLEDLEGQPSPAEPNEPPPDLDHLEAKWSWLDNLKLYRDINGKEEAPADEGGGEEALPDSTYKPLKPGIFTNHKGCTTQITIDTYIYSDSRYDPSQEYSYDPRRNEDGFFIYRSRNGGEFERVATFPAYTDEEDTSPWILWDEDQFGDMLYYASAFNEYGESSSTVMALSLKADQCTDPEAMANPFDIRVDPQGNLLLPFDLDTAYLYIRVGDSAAVRVPEGDRFFLPNSGMHFNLRDYFDGISDQMQMPDLEADLEVWGWLGGQLIYAGDFHYELHHAILSVCDQEGEGACTAGSGQWTNEMAILPDAVKPLEQQKYELRWRSTARSEVHKICYSITPKGYTGSGLTESTNILRFECYYDSGTEFEGGYEGYYTLDFSKILYPEDTSNIPIYTGKSGETYQDIEFKNKYPPGTPYTLSMRIEPVLSSYSLTDISNTILMHNETAFAPPGGPPLESEYASMYDVEILEDTYKPPQYEIWSKWACVIVDEDPSKKYSAGEEVCPVSYVECGVNVECDGFWDYVGAGWDFIVDLISDAKDEIAGKISDVIPGCSNSPACQDVVDQGVDYGAFVVTGIPPDLPNFDELAAQGMAEFIVGGLSGIGGDEIAFVCGDTCKQEIAAQLQPYFEQAKAYYSQPGCFDQGGHYGMFPFCFAPPMKVHPVKGAFDYPAFVMVRVTRKSTPESLAADSSAVEGKLKLYVKGIGKNDQRVGYYGKECYYVDNIPLSDLPDPSKPNSLANSWYFYLGDEPMEEPLYHEVTVSIPWLEPGESIDIPIQLKQQGWFVEPNCILTAKNQYLFFKGTSNISAVEYCYSSDSSWAWVPCRDGGSDSWEFANPQAP